MGYGNYSYAAHQALLSRRADLPIEQVFRNRTCHPLMNPKGVRVRESRDSAGHPQSLGIVFALDVSGSMGEIPHLLATKQLPLFMKVLLDCKIPGPQVLFMALSDATCNEAPLQVGQFESTAELMDQWLTWTYLEGGGCSDMESYELAMYFLATHTEMDCFVKRSKHGYLFMTGDEVPYPAVSRHVVETFIGDRLDEDIPTPEVVAELQKTYTPFFVIPDYERAQQCERFWRNLFGDHVLVLQSASDICFVTTGAILLCEKLVSGPEQLATILREAGMSAKQEKGVMKSLLPLIQVYL
jgi:hypothetical protein